MSRQQSFIAAQTRFDPVYRKHRHPEGAPAPLNGEASEQYETRLAVGLQQACRDARLQKANLHSIHDASVRDAMTEAVLTDAAKAPVKFAPGEWWPVKVKDASGREITNYEGDPNGCWDRINPSYRYVRRFNTPT